MTYVHNNQHINMIRRYSFKHKFIRLGDSWASLQNLIHKALQHENDKIICLARHRAHQFLNNLLSLIDTNARIGFESGVNNDNIRLSGIYDVSYFKTKIRWKFGPYRRICYQFDGRWKGNLKSPPSQDIKQLTKFLDCEFVMLGKHMSVSDNIKMMSKSDLFLGIDSGMAHVAHSVGVPMFLIEYQWPLSVGHGHCSRKYIKCIGTDDAINKVKEYLKRKGLDYGKKQIRKTR